MHDEAGGRPTRTEDGDIRRNHLYREVGEALHLAQVLELHLATVISVLNDRLEANIDVGGLTVPDSSQSLGQLIKSARSAVNLDQNAELVLSRALDRRNHIAHHFFNQHVYAFEHQSVFEEAKTALQDDTKAVALGLVLAQALLEAVCTTFKIDKSSLRYKQDLRLSGEKACCLPEGESMKCTLAFSLERNSPIQERPT